MIWQSSWTQDQSLKMVVVMVIVLMVAVMITVIIIMVMVVVIMMKGIKSFCSKFRILAYFCF
jgi:hypothetical protein